MLTLENTESAESASVNWLTRERSQALKKQAGKINNALQLTQESINCRIDRKDAPAKGIQACNVLVIPAVMRYTDSVYRIKIHVKSEKRRKLTRQRAIQSQICLQ